MAATQILNCNSATSGSGDRTPGVDDMRRESRTRICWDVPQIAAGLSSRVISTLESVDDAVLQQLGSHQSIKGHKLHKSDTPGEIEMV